MITKRLIHLPLGFLKLEDESLREGFYFLKKMRIDWDLGNNCFDRAGEGLYGVFDGDKLIAIGGLSADPGGRNQNKIGRIRYLYVSKPYRNQGIGAGLVHKMISDSCFDFSKLRLRTDSNEAARFYESLGFCPVIDHSASHEFDLLN